MKTGFIWRE